MIVARSPCVHFHLTPMVFPHLARCSSSIVFAVFACGLTLVSTVRAQTTTVLKLGPSGGYGYGLPWTQYSFSFIPVEAETTVTFGFFNEPGGWLFDDASLVRAAVPNLQLMTNGGFETGNLTGWNLSPNGVSEFIGHVGAFPHSGMYSYVDISPYFETISQTIATTPGQVYDLSFSLEEASGPGVTPADDSAVEFTTSVSDISGFNGGISEVPEPSSWALIAGSAALVGAIGFRLRAALRFRGLALSSVTP